MDTGRREFLATLAVGVVGARVTGTEAQSTNQPNSGEASEFLTSLGEAYRPKLPPVRVRKVKTTTLFKAPERSPNAVVATSEGFWIADQRSNNAHLVDANGKLLKSVKTESHNASGMAVGGGYIWMAANAKPYGIYQTDMNSKTVSRRQIPLGMVADGGGCHGAAYVDGKLWIASLRLHGILRVDVQTWQPEFLISYAMPRAHGVAFDKTTNSIWMVMQNEQGTGLIKYDAQTGNTLEIAQFGPADADPHGLTMQDDVLYSCDAGVHPGWPDEKSPTHGYIFRIDLS